MTAADELRAAATTLRQARFTGAMTATPTVAKLISARLPLADWLDALATWAREYPEMAHDHERPACEDYACDVMGRGIALARAINGSHP